MERINYSVMLILLTNLLLLFSCNDNPSDSKAEYKAEIKEYFFYSENIRDTVKLDISVPPGYDENPSRSYKILLMTDGYWRRTEHDTIHQLSINGEIEPLIVAGIGYPDNYNFNQVRQRDLVTNASKFLTCIKSEVIPYLMENYRADSAGMTLWGSSYGGYFLFYAFTNHVTYGGLFKNYIGASVPLNPAPEHQDLMQWENILYGQTKNLPLNLYLTVGGIETTDYLNSHAAIVQRIESHAYTGLNFQHDVLPGKDHYTVWKPTLIDGLKKFLKPR